MSGEDGFSAGDEGNSQRRRLEKSGVGGDVAEVLRKGVRGRERLVGESLRGVGWGDRLE